MFTQLEKREQLLYDDYMTQRAGSGWTVKFFENQILFRPPRSIEAWKEIPLHDPEPIDEFVSLGRAFLKNAEGSFNHKLDENILGFAREWGYLGLCVHKRPLHHGAMYGQGLEGNAVLEPDAHEGKRLVISDLNSWVEVPRVCPAGRLYLNQYDCQHCRKSFPRVVRLAREIVECPQCTGPNVEPRLSEEWFAEYLEDWRILACAATAIFDLFNALREKKRVPRQAVRELANLKYGIGQAGKHYRDLAGDEAKPEFSRSAAWELVGGTLNEWLMGAPVRFFWEFDAEDNQRRVDFVVDNRLGVFPTIAVQLLSILSGRETVTCAGCHLPFIRAYQSTKRNPYCQACRDAKIPQRNASRQMRIRRRQDPARDAGNPS